MCDVPQGKRTVSDQEIIDKMRESEDPAFTTPELAEMFELSKEGIRNRLQDLYDQGRIRKKKPSKRTVIWWTYDDESEPLF